jgi:hypothetical protein
MRKELENEGLIFFFVEGELEGIGTEDREMPLIHDMELDELLKKQENNSI